METFSTLFFSLGHWEFELFISVIFAIFEGLIIYPIARVIWKHHKREHPGTHA